MTTGDTGTIASARDRHVRSSDGENLPRCWVITPAQYGHSEWMGNSRPSFLRTVADQVAN